MRIVEMSARLPVYADWLYSLPPSAVKRLGIRKPKFLAVLAANATSQPYRRTKGQNKLMLRWQQVKVDKIRQHVMARWPLPSL